MEIQQESIFNVIVPEPFSLSRHSDSDKSLITQFIMEENVRKCEKSLGGFYSEYSEQSDFWRVQRRRGNRGNRNLFNSRTGESHRGVEALCTFWFRVLTSHDPYFEAFPTGLGSNGVPLTSEDLYSVEQILLTQKTKTHYKEKLLNVLRSLATFGAVVVELPFVQKPISGSKYFEATDFEISPLIRTYFDTTRSRIDLSHYIANVDYITDYSLYDLAQNDTESYDMEAIEKNLDSKNNGNVVSNLNAYSLIRERMDRGGYQESDTGLNELLNYHGRLNKDCLKTDLIAELWEKEGDPNQNPRNVDFSFRVLNGQALISGYPTQYGDWRTRFVSATYKRFENEPIGYGVPRIGKKSQLEMDFMTSNAADLSTMSLFNMWLVNPMSGLKQSQLGIKPLNMIEVDDVHNSIVPLRPDVNAINYAINLINTLKTDFRSTTGASDTLQAQITGASATESSLAQNEAVRQQSVHAEIIGETLVRDSLEISHLNNCNHLDASIWVALSGSEKTEFKGYNRLNIPRSVGFRIKTTSDKDYRPERINKLTSAGQYLSSIRQMIPPEIVINGTKYLSKEIFRELGIDPRLLGAPISLKDKIEFTTRSNQLTGRQGPAGSGSPSNVGNEIAGEISSAQSGGLQDQQTPLGPIDGSVNQDLGGM